MSYGSKKPSRAKRSPERISNVTVGTHISRGSKNSSRNTSSKQASYSNAKKNARARRGMVEQVMPETLSGETAAEHAKRVSRPHYTVALKRHSSARGVVIGILVTVLILAIAVIVGGFAFVNSVNEKMALTNTDTKAALVLASEDEPAYVLLVGEFFEAGKEYTGPELIMLARLDAETKQVTLMSIPPDTQVALSNGEYRRIAEAQLLGDDSELITEVSELMGVSISHIVKADDDQFVDLIDEFGGITVDVAEEVDDPNAGSVYLPAGEQTLDGKSALTLCRATNFSTGEKMRSENQCKVVTALAKKVLELESIDMLLTLDRVAEKIETDVDFMAAISLIDSFRGISDDYIYSERIPGYSMTSEETGNKFFILNEAVWVAMQAAMDSGERPSDAIPEAAPINPADFDITVRNGSGVTGGAQQVADVLYAAGFPIKETGNADLYVYEETLVIYHTENMMDAAEAAVEALGVGRAVASNGFYTFESSLLVVVGKDWKPLN